MTLQITGLGACYRCGKPASMSINLAANAAGGSGSHFVPACEECYPSSMALAHDAAIEACAKIVHFAEVYDEGQKILCVELERKIRALVRTPKQ